MKPDITLVSILEKVVGESGATHYVGSLPLGQVKKLKRDELRMVAVPGDQMPQSLHELRGSDEKAREGLFLYVESRPVEKAKRGR